MRRSTAIGLCAAAVFCGSSRAFAASGTIFGEDDRAVIANTQSAPYSAVCRLVITWPDGSIGYATGFAYGETLVATAAHALYDPEKGGEAARIGLYFGGADLSVDSTSSRLHYPKGWERSQGWREDYGAIALSEPLGSEIEPLELASYPPDRLRGMEATLLGYDYRSFDLYESSGTIDRARQYDLLYRMDVMHGESGGPVLDSAGRVIGIANYGAEQDGLSYNSAARMSGPAYRFLQDLLKSAGRS